MLMAAVQTRHACNALENPRRHHDRTQEQWEDAEKKRRAYTEGRE
jgi:hypothetical protein